jgi:hypothetical protein
MITENQAIRELYAGPVSFTHNGVFYHGDFERPTESEIQAKIAELTASEPMRLLRIKRNQLLQQTDWMALSDRVMTQAQIDFRQALRDLPANSTPALDENGNLTGITWPTPPND